MENLKQIKSVRFNIFLIISLCISLITIKLSGAPFACFTMLFIFYSYRNIIFLKEKFFITLLISILILPHLIRGYYISGYPLFPLTFGSQFEPDWKMELMSVQSHSQIISCWAKSILMMVALIFPI